MLQGAGMFFGIAIVAAIVRFGGVAGSAAGFAQALFVLFLAVFLITLIRGWMGHPCAFP